MEQQGGVQLPRALDVQRFAGAREQEIRALCSALKGSQLGAKFGVAALPRHLRRRAGSHKPYHNHRFRPNAKLTAKRRKLEPIAEAGEEAGSEATAADGARPAAEDAAVAAERSAAHAFTNRRMRRRSATLQDCFRQSAAWTEASLAASAETTAAAVAAAASSRSAGSSSGLRRLETHVWHAKRLAMEEMYGWLLPAGVAGHGRGRRSFVHASRVSTLIHDASYLCPLLLRGAWHSVHSVLSALLDPAQASALVADWAASSSGSGSGGRGDGGCTGGWEQAMMLHQPGRFPRGAICPAQLLLCPASATGSGGSSNSGMDVNEVTAAEAGACDAGSTGSVQALLWVHPAAASEAAAALRTSASSSSSGFTVSVLDLRRIEVRGGAADAALAVALAGATAGAMAAGSAEARQQAQQQQQQRALQPQLPAPLAALEDGDAVQLLLPDPRLCKPVALGSAAANLLPAGSTIRQHLNLQRLQAVPLPLSEAELSRRRQQLRRRLLQLDTVGAAADEPPPTQQQQQEQRSHCPAVLVRHDPPGRGGIPGWSLVLPAGWVLPFWLAAAYAGCKPMGQREWRWLHTLQGRRCFPWDHPDTLAYAALVTRQQQQQQASVARRPPGKKQLAGQACLPPWERLLAGGGGSRGGEDAPQPGEHQQQQLMDIDATAERPCPGSGSTSGTGSSLYVARSYAAMAAALHDSSRGSSKDHGGGNAESTLAVAAGPWPGGPRPVAAALHQGLLQWRPRRPADAPATASTDEGTRGKPARSSSRCSRRSCCLLEAAVQPIQSGAVAEGAALCFIAGREAERWRHPLWLLGAKHQRRRQQEREQLKVALLEAGGDPEAGQELVGGLASLSGSTNPGPSSTSGYDGSSSEVEEEQVHVFGYVLSETPCGASCRCGSLAAVEVHTAWHLRSLQHWGPRLDSGTIEALAHNPGSAVLVPVHLQLLLEVEAQ